MHFRHSTEIWTRYPQLVPGVLRVDDIAPQAAVQPHIDEMAKRAQSRLSGGAESELAEIQAWRRVFAAMGLKPTQYRCASEALLRRFRKEGTLPRLHPLIDLCNAVSIAYAVPVAVFDVARIEAYLEVRPAAGSEIYHDFSGAEEHPEPGEVIFADGAGRAHARRWTHRQSAHSAVRPETSGVLIVAEAVHATARADMEALVAALAAALRDVGYRIASTAILEPGAPQFRF